VAALGPAHVVAAVTFAANHKLRLVVKGTGHDYYGRSTAPDSLQVHTPAILVQTCIQVWTHYMRDLQFIDSFTPSGCSGPARPAARLGAGLTWMDVDAAATDRNHYVHGGGCSSVGVVGWLIGP
jgi:FAD/FMN-containing dehydrogenase